MFIISIYFWTWDNRLQWTLKISNYPFFTFQFTKKKCLPYLPSNTQDHYLKSRLAQIWVTPILCSLSGIKWLKYSWKFVNWPFHNQKSENGPYAAILKIYKGWIYCKSDILISFHRLTFYRLRIRLFPPKSQWKSQLSFQTITADSRMCLFADLIFLLKFVYCSSQNVTVRSCCEIAMGLIEINDGVGGGKMGNIANSATCHELKWAKQNGINYWCNI